jgi:hypothetical protein
MVYGDCSECWLFEGYRKVGFLWNQSLTQITGLRNIIELTLINCNYEYFSVQLCPLLTTLNIENGYFNVHIDYPTWPQLNSLTLIKMKCQMKYIINFENPLHHLVVKNCQCLRLKI